MDEQEHEPRKNEAIIVAWIAFILAAVAMLLSIAAFNRAGADIDEVVQREVSQYTQEAEIIALRAKATVELATLRASIEVAQTGDAVAEEVVEARENIEDIYSNASDEVKQEAREIDRELEQVESAVRTDTAQGLDQLEDLISRMEMDVRTDEE